MANLDPQIVNLTKAIRQTETGGNFTATGKSGEYGAYQFTQPTWDNLSQKYLGQKIDLKSATPQQQNEVAYKQIADWKNAGNNVGQIASMWNAGESEPNAYTGTFSNGKPSTGTNNYGVKFNVPAYAKSVATAYQALKTGSSVGIDPNNPSSVTAPQSESGVMFPSSPTDTGLQAGLKAIGNTPQSAVNFGIGVAKSLNPLQTASTIGQIGNGFQDLANTEGTGKAIWDIVKGLPEAAYHALVPQGVQSLLGGDISGASKAFTNDPFGQAAPVVLAAEGGAKLADTYGGGLKAAAENNANTFNETGLNVMPKEGIYTKAFGDAVSGIAKPVIDTASKVGSLPLKTLTPVISLFTSLSPDTIKTIVSDPASFSKLQREATSRASVAENFGASLDEIIKQKGETGAEYQTIRDNKAPVSVPIDFIYKTLRDNGFKISDGKIIADTNSVTRNPADISALQNFYDNWGQKKSMTANEYLNMRSDIAGLSKFDAAKSGAAATIGKELYGAANDTVRPKIQGLKELDAKMSPQIEQFKLAKKDFLNSDGTFKDGAINKIANSTGLGKEKLLARMETISPGITKSIQVLKAVEDIQKSNGIKVGSYVKSIVEGGAILSGNLPLIVAAILTYPAIAVQILRGFGLSGKAVLPVVQALQDLSGGAKNYSSLGLTKDQNEK